MNHVVRTSWKETRSPLEHWVEGVLSRLGEDARAAGESPNRARTVVLGGGTGLSTVLGGNSSLSNWPDRPAAGLAREFANLHVGVCTTDDGGSTGELVRRLPMIGIGDLRKVTLSMADRDELARRYGADAPLGKIVQHVLLHRFGGKAPVAEDLADPVRVLTPSLQRACPPELRAALGGLSEGLDSTIAERMLVPGQCLGNLLMTAAAFRGQQGAARPPTAAELESGLGAAASAIGAPAGRIFAATNAPGTLIYEYANGVVASGQSRAARAKRGCAVSRVRIAFAEEPRANPGLVERLRKAELIVYAPGSLYSSMLPILLIPGVVEAIRSNRRATKILGANLWIQEGETDMSFREESGWFWGSELSEAYGRNVPGGIEGLFDVALATSLDAVPGSTIRNYALEGKHPIHLDRARVAALGVMPVEASLFSFDRWQRDSMIHHDPARFAAAVRTVYEGLAREKEWKKGRKGRAPRTERAGRTAAEKGLSACARMEEAKAELSKKEMAAGLREAAEEFQWAHPDVRGGHLAHFAGARAVPEAEWKRSQEWDNVLGYYDPDTRWIVLHEQALKKQRTFQANFAVALGESLLGRYVARKGWREVESGACRIYEIDLLPPESREGYLAETQLKKFLEIAQMRPCRERPGCHWRAVPPGSGFLPSGVLFGLSFAWMLDNAFVPALDFEMRMLQWPASRLLPYQVKVRARLRELVRFFREEVFRNG